jgi:hypothetical protein
MESIEGTRRWGKPPQLYPIYLKPLLMNEWVQKISGLKDKIYTDFHGLTRGWVNFSLLDELAPEDAMLCLKAKVR